ncbi:MAG: hypothetical protein ACK55I_26600, partial [bacterium]
FHHLAEEPPEGEARHRELQREVERLPSTIEHQRPATGQIGRELAEHRLPPHADEADAEQPAAHPRDEAGDGAVDPQSLLGRAGVQERADDRRGEEAEDELREAGPGLGG